MTTTTTTHRPATAHRRDARGGALVGTGTLVRFILRRDRVRITVWVTALTVLTVGTGAAYPGLYPTAADRQAQAAIMTSNPAMAAMSGPGYGTEDYTFGAMMSNEMLGFVAILVALMSVLLVVRHTRAEEESDRAELIRASVVGRHAHLSAAVATVTAVNLALGAIIAVGYASLGIDSMDWIGSIAFGAGLTAVGLVFTGIAAVTAQVTQSARATSGLAGALIGVAYALRAAGDMGDGTLSWLSPIGWAQQVRAYVDERWWPLGLALATALALVAAAYALSTRRDVGAGMINQRAGAATASDRLATPLGFALRLQRGSLLGWTAAMGLFGLAYGSAAGVIEEYSDNAFIQEIMADAPGTSLVEQWLSMIVSVLAMVCTVYAIQAVLRLRGEETGGRAEPVLATPLSRVRWVVSHVAVAFGGGAVVLLVTGAALGATAGVSQQDAQLTSSLLGAAAAHLPAMWLTAGLAVAVFGVLPRAMPLAWAVLVYSIFMGYLGVLLQLPEWMMNLSPFGHVPRLPGEELTLLPLLLLAAGAVALVALGLVGVRRRDIGAA